MTGVLAALEATPAWTNGARVALQRHRAALAGDDPRVLLRAAELALAAGGVAAAGLLRSRIRQGPDRRLAFLDARLLARRPDQPAPDPEGDDLRAETVRAEAAYARGRFEEAAAAWERVLRLEGEGLLADELRYEAAVARGRLLLASDQPAEALALLEQAADLARRRQAPHDEAGTLLWRYEALVRLGRTEDLVALGRRGQELPPVDVGGLPPALVHHLLAVGEAARKDVRGAVEALEAGIRALDPRADAAGWAALSLAKATALEAAGRDDEVFRILVLARNRLRRSGASFETALFDPVIASFRERVGEPLWQELYARLRDEVRGS